MYKTNDTTLLDIGSTISIYFVKNGKGAAFRAAPLLFCIKNTICPRREYTVLLQQGRRGLKCGVFGGLL